MGLLALGASAVAIAFCALFIREWRSMVKAREARIGRTHAPAARPPRTRRVDEGVRGANHADGRRE